MTFAKEITVEALEADPYPIYERLRREAPIAYVPAVNLWFVTRFKDVELVSKSPELFTAEVASSPLDRTWGKPTILTTDGPVHKNLRSGVDPKYHPKRVATYMDDLVLPIAEDCLSRLRKGGGGGRESDGGLFRTDPFSASLARSVCRMWISKPCAAGSSGWRKARSISNAIRNARRSPMPSAPRSAGRWSRSWHASSQSRTILPCLICCTTVCPKARRAFEFLLPTFKVLLLGGMQEPGHGAGSIMAGLLQNAEQFAAVKADIGNLLPRAVDEGLRWVTPIGTQTRQTTQDVDLGGVTIPAGQAVAAVLASASHCESRFTDPGRFDIHRSEGSHAAFGFGHHFCAGRWFARQQITVALRYLIENAPDIALRDDGPVVFKGWEFRAPVSLDIRLGD